MVDVAYKYLFSSALVVIGICMLAMIIRSIKGPKIADRLVSVNLVGTMVIIVTVILSFLLDEGFLLDVALIYVLISFLAVVVFNFVFINSYLGKKKDDERKKLEEMEQAKKEEEK